MQNQAVLPELLEVDIAVKNRFWNPVLYCNVLYCTVQVLEPAVRGPAHLHRAGAQVGAGAGAAAARLRLRHQGVGGPPRRPGQVSCDWWRAGHVTTVLTSDWSRLPIELEVVQFSEHRGLTLASLRVNMSESHFDNDLVFETEFEKIVEKYDNYNGPDVFGRTFKRYSKSR